MDAKLKECPFCGGKARHLAGQIGFYSERVICDACDFYLTPAVWNNRPAAIAPPVAAGSVDLMRYHNWNGAMLPDSKTGAYVDYEAAVEYAEHRVYEALAGQSSCISALQATITEQSKRAEKAEKQWDSWMACANHWQGRAEKAEARVKELEENLRNPNAVRFGDPLPEVKVSGNNFNAEEKAQHTNAIDPSDTPC